MFRTSFRTARWNNVMGLLRSPFAGKTALGFQGCALTLRTTRPMLNPCTRIDDSTTM
jgi:hypothetical protein